MSELLFCPFCGGEAEMLTAESMNGGYLFGIMCNDCRSRGDVYDTEAEAIAAWNTRVDYHGYEKAAIEAWESIKAWNNRAERICKPTEEYCCQCGQDLVLCDMGIGPNGGAVELDPPILFNYCPNCGCKVVGE